MISTAQTWARVYSIATRMPGSIIEYSPTTTTAPLSTSTLLPAEQLQPLAAAAAATVCIASLSYHFLCGT